MDVGQIVVNALICGALGAIAGYLSVALPDWRRRRKNGRQG